MTFDFEEPDGPYDAFDMPLLFAQGGYEQVIFVRKVDDRGVQKLLDVFTRISRFGEDLDDEDLFNVFVILDPVASLGLRSW